MTNILAKDFLRRRLQVVKELKPDNFTPRIVQQTSDYLYVEYESPTFGFIDDVVRRSSYAPVNR
jgi:uncharacterized protein (DUF1499 family)